MRDEASTRTDRIARSDRRTLALIIVLALVMFLVGSLRSVSLAANPAADIDQCSNGAFATPVTCTGSAWVNGDLNANNSHYREGNSVPFRIKFSNLSTGPSHTVQIQWDTTKSGKHAYDYLTTYNRTETTAVPCSGVTGCSGSGTTYAIPLDSNISMLNGHTPVAGNFTCFGCTITGTSSYALTGAYTGDSSTAITLTFSASVSNPVLAWGGHIASSIDWGQGNSASAVSGSPYHMRILGLDGVGGNQDRSIKASAVLPEPTIVTAVSSSGGSYADTATLSGANGTPSGTVSFFYCGPTTSATPCVSGGTGAGTVALSGGTATSSSVSPGAAGTYCFRVEYTPDSSAQYSPGVSSVTTNECFSVKASPTIATTLSATTSVAIGTAVHDSATLSGATSNAGGTVTYTVYTDSSCTAGPQAAGTKTVTNGSVPDSNAITFNSAGTFYWQAVYSGDANNNTASSLCTSEQLVVGMNSPTIATTLSATTSVAIGTAVHDSATLSGATSNAGGTVTYTVYTDNACTQNAQAAGTKTVTNGSVPDSDAITFNSAGTFYWQAVYSGDANNNTASSLCTSEQLVVGKNTPGIATAQKLRPNDSATITGATTNAGGTISFKLFSPSDANCSGTPSYSETVNVSGNNTYSTNNTTFDATDVGTWRWLVEYSGDSNNQGTTSACGVEHFTITNQ